MNQVTRRVYLAAHAPAVPDWYKGPDFPFPVPPLPDPVRLSNPEFQKAARTWMQDDAGADLAAFIDGIRGEVPAEINQFQDDVARHYEAVREREEKRQQIRYFSWPWYYADMMLHFMKPEGRQK